MGRFGNLTLELFVLGATDSVDGASSRARRLGVSSRLDCFDTNRAPAATPVVKFDIAAAMIRDLTITDKMHGF